MTTRTLTLLSLIAGGIIVLSNPAAVTAGSCFGSSSCPGASYNPEVVISATPQAITAGEGTYVRFENPPGVDQCSANFPYTEIPFAYTSADFSSWTNAGGYLNDYPTATKTYTVTCRKVIESGYGVSTASVTVTVTPAPAVDLAAGSVSPSSATADTPVTLSSTITNVGVAATPSGFTNLFQRATDSSGSGATDIGTYTYSSVLAASGSFSATRSYTFASAGTWYVRTCVC